MVKKAQELLAKVPVDKLLHFMLGALVALATGFVSISFALVMVALVAVGKEVRDKVSGKGTPEWADIVATIAGGLTTLLLLVLLY